MHRYYVSPAESWLAGRGWVTDYEENFIPPPLQGVFVLAIEAALPGASYGTLRAVQAWISALAIPLAFWIGLQMGVPERAAWVGLVSAALVAVDPDLIDHVSILLAESNYVVLLFAFLGVLLLAVRRRSARLLAASGALLGLASLAKPFPFLLCTVVPAHLLLRHRDRRAAVGALAFAAAFALVVAPWIARNALRYGAVYSVSSNGGTALAASNFLGLDASRDVYFESVVGGTRWRDPAIEARFAGVRDRYGQREWNEKDRAYARHAVRYALAHPLHFLRNYAIKVVNVFRHTPPAGRDPWIPSRAFRIALVAAGLPGFLWFAGTARRRPESVMTWVFAYHVAFLALFYISDTGRAQLPTKVLLSFFAAYGAVELAAAGARTWRYTERSARRVFHQ